MTPLAAPSLGAALRYWLKLGCIGFGGPAGQIALMHDELVTRRRWISERRFMHALDYCMMLPGPEAQQLATYLGWLLHRTAGGVAAGVLFVLPSLGLLIALSWVYCAYGRLAVVAALFHGIKPAVTAIVAHAGWRIAQRALRTRAAAGIAVGAFAAVAGFNVPFPLVVVVAAFAGAALCRSAAAKPAGEAAAPIVRYLIDDDTPPPPHARFAWSRTALLVVAFAVLWAAPFTLLVAAFGRDAAPTTMAVFFTKAALLTFGGAYAVLPYVFQAAVDHFHWVSTSQMIDGLALGETTPGPLIIVVAFVGFVAGWSDAFFGVAARGLAGACAAAVVAYYTFLPSFFFVLAGAPLIEATHGKLRYTAPLAGISAAVVGVIASLAVFFAAQVLWPRGWSGPFDAVAATIGVAAAFALFRLRAGLLPVIAGCGVAGLVAAYLPGA